MLLHISEIYKILTLLRRFKPHKFNKMLSKMWWFSNCKFRKCLRSNSSPLSHFHYSSDLTVFGVLYKIAVPAGMVQR